MQSHKRIYLSNERNKGKISYEDHSNYGLGDRRVGKS